MKTQERQNNIRDLLTFNQLNTSRTSVSTLTDAKISFSKNAYTLKTKPKLMKIEPFPQKLPQERGLRDNSSNTEAEIVFLRNFATSKTLNLLTKLKDLNNKTHSFVETDTNNETQTETKVIDTRNQYTQRTMIQKMRIPNGTIEEKLESFTQTDNPPHKNESAKGIQIGNGEVPRFCPRKIITETAIVTPQSIINNSSTTQTENDSFPEGKTSHTCSQWGNGLIP